MRIAMLLCLLSAATAHADDDTYHLVPFRGHLEQNGVPFTAPVSLHVDLFGGDDPRVSTTSFYSEDITPKVQPTPQGDFSILLGQNGTLDGKQSVTLDVVLAQNPHAWVELSIIVDPNDRTKNIVFSPRQRLYSAPFATLAEGLSRQLCAPNQMYIKDASGQWICASSVPNMTVGPSPDGLPLHIAGNTYSGAGLTIDNPWYGLPGWNEFTAPGYANGGSGTQLLFSPTDLTKLGVQFTSVGAYSVVSSTAVRLNPVSRASVSCNEDGTVILTTSYMLCVCKAGTWVRGSDGVSACVF